MKDNDSLYDIEKKIGAAVAEECASAPLPPFSVVLSRLSASGREDGEGEWTEPSVEEKADAARRRRIRPSRVVVGLSAAAVVVFLTGGLLLNVMLNRKESAQADSAVEYSENPETDGEMGEIGRCSSGVSDSDLREDSDECSSGQPERDGE